MSDMEKAAFPTDPSPVAPTKQASGRGDEPTTIVENLRISFGSSANELVAVDGVSFSIQPGTCLALVGESGSGKSVTARALMGLSGGRVSADRLVVAGTDTASLGQRGWRRLRSRHLAMVPQDALMALDPLRPVGREIGDALAGTPRRERAARVEGMLEAVGLPDPSRAARSRSPELSGGMRQRALLAQALISDPALVIADEATTALDTRLTALVLEQLRSMTEAGRAVLLISHDLAQVAHVADTIAVMRKGRIVETGDAKDVLTHPRHHDTRMLLAAIPDRIPRFQRLLSPPGESPSGAGGGTPNGAPSGGRGSGGKERSRDAARPEIALRVTDLCKHFGPVRAVDGVSFEVAAGRTLGIVGESGCGKTTTARLILGLIGPDAGEVELRGRCFAPVREAERRKLRSDLGAVYQNPLGSFDSRFRVGEILANALTAGASRSWRPRAQRIRELLDQVHLDSAILSRYPLELSGGQRQRLAIARALAPGPSVLVLDEPVSALDVSVQARVLDLLDEIQLATSTSYVFISHDLGVVEHMSDEVAVMHEGKIVEIGPPEKVLHQPEHPYTSALLRARMRQMVPSK